MSDFSVAHARIERGVQDVDAEIDQHIDAGEHRRDALDHRVVPSYYRRDDEIADPGLGAHGLSDDGVAEQPATASPITVRGARIPQCMLEDHDPWCQALDARSSHQHSNVLISAECGMLSAIAGMIK